jgi:hypothetical protein
MKRALCGLLACWLAAPVPSTPAVEGKKAMYVRGTVSAIREKQQGILDTSGASTFVFRWETSKWEVPFTCVTKMVYRNKVGRHVAASVATAAAAGATAATTAVVGTSGLFVLLAKKKKHYLSLELKNESGQVEVVVFELSKGIYEEVVADLEEKTGLRLEVELEKPSKKR